MALAHVGPRSGPHAALRAAGDPPGPARDPIRFRRVHPAAMETPRPRLAMPTVCLVQPCRLGPIGTPRGNPLSHGWWSGSTMALGRGRRATEADPVIRRTGRAGRLGGSRSPVTLARRRSSWWCGTSTTPCGTARSARDRSTSTRPGSTWCGRSTVGESSTSICSKNDPRAGPGRAGAGRAVGRVRVRPDRLVAQGRAGGPDHRGRPAASRRTSCSSTTWPSTGRRCATPSPGSRWPGPEIIEQLLGRPELAGKDDRDLTRLDQYRVLERKLADRQADRRAPTRSSSGRATSVVGVFTDARVRGGPAVRAGPPDQPAQLHQAPARPRRVRRPCSADTRRDLGLRRGPRPLRGLRDLRVLLGRRPTADALTDFLFSCRVLNMGVEQWLYDQPRAARPRRWWATWRPRSTAPTVDWITADDAVFDADGLRVRRVTRAGPAAAPPRPDGRGLRP